MSAELNLTLTLSGESTPRYLMLLRDEKANTYPNCFTSPGGMLDRTPTAGSLKQANEEMTTVVRKRDDYYCLLLSYEGETGTTAAQKRARLEIALPRLAKQYPRRFEGLTANDIDMHTVVPRADDYAASDEVELTILDDGFVYKGWHTVINNRAINAIHTQKNLRIDAYDVPADDLIWGETVFAADSDSPHYERRVHTMTSAEILYARYPEGIDAPPRPPAALNSLITAQWSTTHRPCARVCGPWGINRLRRSLPMAQPDTNAKYFCQI